MKTTKSRKMNLRGMFINKNLVNKDFGLISGYKVEKVGSKRKQEAKKRFNKKQNPVIFSFSV